MSVRYTSAHASNRVRQNMRSPYCFLAKRHSLAIGSSYFVARCHSFKLGEIQPTPLSSQRAECVSQNLRDRSCPVRGTQQIKVAAAHLAERYALEPRGCDLEPNLVLRQDERRDPCLGTKRCRRAISTVAKQSEQLARHSHLGVVVSTSTA